VSALRDVSRAPGRRREGRLTLLPAVICLFPGQGAQRVGMGRDLARDFPSARRTFEEVDDQLGMALSRLCFEGPGETLELTEYAQPALLACSVAAYRVARESSAFEPVVMAGHSLGEWSALVAAGALSLGDAARGVRERGRLMQEAVPVGTGAMAAVMGLEASVVEALCVDAAGGEVLAAANLNGAGQVVVAGHRGAVERLVGLARARRAKAQLLAVSAPFHCALMTPAAEGLAPFLATVDLRLPATPVCTSVEGRLVTGTDDIRSLLACQLTAPVRWDATMEVLGKAPARLAVEFGVGRALSGLWKRTVSAIPVLPVGEPGGVAALREGLA